jgi:hypothetical protein
MFRLRMQRDNREAEYDQLVEKYRAEGKKRVFAIYAAMREMGYEGAEKERKYYQIHLGREHANYRIDKERECQNRYHRKMRTRPLDDVMDTLKPNAPPEQEMDWVTGHRKLFHVAQLLLETETEETKDELKRALRLTADDIKTAPSQSAVTMLLTAMQDPSEWMKKKRDAHKSKTGAGTTAEDSSDVVDDLTTLQRIHKQFIEQQKAK